MDKILLLIPLFIQILPVVINVVRKVEQSIQGVKMGVVKKAQAMELVQRSLDTKNMLLSIFGLEVDANDGRVMSFVDKLIDMIVFLANIFGIFSTTTRIDTRTIDTSSDGKALTEIVTGLWILTMFILLFSLISCGGFFKPKPYVVSEYIEYPAPPIVPPGPLEGDYKSSDMMVERYKQVLECTETTIPIPPPNLVVYGCEVFEGCEVNGVMCDGKAMAGCYDPNTNTIMLPAKTDMKIVDHEMVHHICNHNPSDKCKEPAEFEGRHYSEYFNKCSGVLLMN